MAGVNPLDLKMPQSKTLNIPNNRRKVIRSKILRSTDVWEFGI